MPQNYLVAPVTIEDVTRMIGESTYDLGTLCQSTKINKWAKYKPVVFAKIGLLTETNRQAANYGIHNIPTWGITANGSLEKMMNFWLQHYKTTQNQPDCGIVPEYWSYLQPSGGSSSPYRLADFVKDTSEGYFHSAVAPIAPIQNTTIEITPGGQLSLVFVNGAQSNMTLKYTDLTLETGGQMSLAGYYFGVALIRKADVAQSSATRYVQTEMAAADAISLGAHVYTFFQYGTDIASFLGQADQADFYLMPFLANDQIYDTFSRTSGGTTTTYKKFLTSFNGVTADKFAALLERQEVTIVRKYANVKVVRLTSARRSGQTNIIDTDWEVTNFETNYDVTISNMTIEYLDINGGVIYVDPITQDYNVRSGMSVIGTSSHNFGSAGTANIYNARMSIQSLQGVISFNINDSIKIAIVS